MKIALVSQEYPPESAKGGIGSQTFTKAKGLSASGHEVYVISFAASPQRTEIKEGNISVIRIPGMEKDIPEMTETVQWITRSVSVAAEIETLHRLVGLDIIDFPEWAAEGYVYLLNRSLWNRIPVVIQLHGPLVMFAHTMDWPELNSAFYKAGTHMEATCIQLADAVYSSAACSVEWIRKYYFPVTENIPVIHLGVDTGIFSSKQAVKNERPTIIFSGKIVGNKGVEELVEAACNLVRSFPELLLKMIGRGDEKLIAKLNAYAERCGAAQLLEFPGFMEKEDLSKALSESHVFAAPSYYEGGPGFVYLEAMACGLPVVGCSGSGVDEIVTSGENGFLVTPKNVAGLERALERILAEPTLREAMGVKAREFVRQHADSRDCIKKLEAFYGSVVQREASKKEITAHE
ncbi:MAG: glycosyltransferase family 4 protein [Ferruginibacter sp.]